MAIGPRLELRQSQSLVMTPQLRQAIKLLQFSNLEVAAFVEEQLERNPLLERAAADDVPAPERPAPDQVPRTANGADTAELAASGTLPDAGAAPLDADYANSYDPGGAADGGAYSGTGGGRADFASDERGPEDFVASRPSLREHLGSQLRLGFADPAERLIGAHLIALLDPAGRLTAAPEAIARAMGVKLARVEAVRARMMRFDPVGLFARDLKECLAAQLADRNRLDPAMRALLDNLDVLARRDTRRLMALCGVDAEDMSEMVAELRALDPKPGWGWEESDVAVVVPDVLVRAAHDGGWIVELNPETLPRVLVNHPFYARIAPRAAKADRAFLSEQLASATWLVKSLAQRGQTILKVAGEIMRRQDGFLRHGIAHLRPLILRDIAAATELHESTISRVTANKYVATPRGIFELKYFFTTAIAGLDGESHSAERIRHRIRDLIAAEAADGILSDDALVAALRNEGVDIARRTVAKYREALRIPSSVQRKRDKAPPV
ncbi:MAG: RNA polymerase factor sigma-54 [Rhodospirillales bacterium]|nr:RNA polymerase factor sigma-54 [Rhodospirillales bacterium]